MAGSYSLGEHLDRFVKELVVAGYYNNESEVIRDALRQLEIRQLKLAALRQHVQHALDQGGSYTDEDIDSLLADEQ